MRLFTGIVKEVGEVAAVERTDDGARLRVACAFATDLGLGDSVAVAGACLTVAERHDAGFTADVMNQTLALTTLGDLAAGDRVNLEPALRAGDPLGGHMVQGHVDGAAEVAAVEEDGIARRLRAGLPDGLERYAVARGSIAIEGVSLTLATVAEAEVEVSLIPETLKRTTLGDLAPGDRVNVEMDLIARHVERLMPSFGRENR